VLFTDRRVMFSCREFSVIAFYTVLMLVKPGCATDDRQNRKTTDLNDLHARRIFIWHCTKRPVIN